eukprot:TRINITY_DN5091_c0_g1_i2.p1 TRINITY_DN5091_c0_g1~~TRINITY_DN5091_c0_g1_i2.p1  ORF type:complete len:184 (+),score=20.69 TRINITY_DN5091_c0_g1_i2:98-649(+)
MTTELGSIPDSNPRGIPKAVFVENVEEFMKNESSADAVLKHMQENYSKYKFMETNLSKSKANLKGKIPEIRKNLEMLNYLASKKGDQVTSNFELSDQIFATANINPETVCLWLGANVMLEYSFDEAQTLLTTNLEEAGVKLASLDEDLEFLKDQITTTEVNIARIFNWDVKTRRKAREAAAAK